MTHNAPVFPYKLAAIDIDQTLVGPDKRIGSENRHAIRRLQNLGCRVILASGRRHDNMLPFQRELGLEDFIVSTQGAVARDPRKSRPLHEATLGARDVAELLAEGARRDLTVMHWSRRGVVANERSRWVDHYIKDCRDPVSVNNLQGLAGERAEKIVWGASPSTIASLAPQIRGRYHERFEITVTDDFFIEFTSRDATKAAGVAAVAKYHEIDAAEVLTFGDGNNDVSMLAWAGMGVAMSHARPAARAAAKLIAPAGNPESSLARGVAAVLASLGFVSPNGDDRVGAAA
ncbi:MAG TPA: Cof-type HAD-IIB family hydrolase [Tepidisphaeraceae bacterium]|jgi:Cof subfamily protein (haloacid dehalogenase superfamily)